LELPVLLKGSDKENPDMDVDSLFIPPFLCKNKDKGSKAGENAPCQCKTDQYSRSDERIGVSPDKINALG
jgi:hypothetical protein